MNSRINKLIQKWHVSKNQHIANEHKHNVDAYKKINKLVNQN